MTSLDDRQRLRRLRRGGGRDHRRDDVAEHRARGLRAARAGARHRDLRDGVGLDRDRVERAVDGGQRMLAVEERRVHAHADPAVDALGGADQLQPEPELVRVGHVVGRDVLDPLVDDLVEVDRGRERQPGEDRHLGGGVAARHVVGRVGLRVAQLLGLHQRLLVGDAGARHLGEDVVRRAVDDPVDALDVRGRQRLLQHADHRHDAGHRALEAQLDLVLARARPQLLPVLGEQLLVGRDDVLARAHRPQHVVARRLDAADQLHDQVRALEDLPRSRRASASARR